MSLLSRLIAFAASAFIGSFTSVTGPFSKPPRPGATVQSRGPGKQRNVGQKPLSGYKLARRFFPGISRAEALRRFGSQAA